MRRSRRRKSRRSRRRRSRHRSRRRKSRRSRRRKSRRSRRRKSRRSRRRRSRRSRRRRGRRRHRRHRRFGSWTGGSPSSLLEMEGPYGMFNGGYDAGNASISAMRRHGAGAMRGHGKKM